MKHSILLSVGWLVTVGALCAAVTMIDLHWNLFFWYPSLDFIAMACGLGILGALVVICFLARFSRDQVSQVISLILCLSLLGLAIYWLPAEATDPGFFGRTRSSPLWFRGGRVFLLSVPGLFWFWGRFCPRK
jgi:hypothetical protein